MGRPTKWNLALNDALIDAFDLKVFWEERVKSTTDKGETTERIPKMFPQFFQFERAQGINIGLLSRWAKIEEDLVKECEEKGLKYDEETKKPGFLQAYNGAKQLQKNFLMQNALQGLYPPATFIFIAKNITDMRDQTAIDLTTQGEKMNTLIQVVSPSYEATDNNLPTK